MFFSDLRMCVRLEPSQSRKCRSDVADVIGNVKNRSRS